MTTTVIDLSVERSVMLNLGRVGENGVTEFVFDYANWTEEFGEGVLSLVLKRQGDAEGYPKSMTVESGQSTWVVDSTDVGVEGIGEAQLTYTVNGDAKKSVIYLTRTCPSIEPVGPAPDPYQSWLDQMIEAKEDAEDAAERAETAAENLDTKGYYPDMRVGTADNLLSSSYVSDSEPYLLRRTPYGARERGSIVGGSIVWNQMLQPLNSNDWRAESGVTATYTDGVATVSSTTANNGIYHLSYLNVQLHKYLITFDANGASGLTIALSVSGAQGMAVSGNGTGSWTRYSAVVNCTGGAGSRRLYLLARGSTYENVMFRNVMLIDLTLMFGPTIADYIYAQEHAFAGAGVALAKALAGITADYYPYDEGSIKSVTGLTAHRMTDGNGDVIGEYPLDSSLTLRGLPKLDGDSVYYDGDIYNADGTVTRRYGIVDLGTLDWTYVTSIESGNRFYAPFSLINKTGYTNADAFPILCPRYISVAFYSGGVYMGGLDKSVAYAPGSGSRFLIADSAYTDAASFKAAMSGVYLVYELANPTTETAEPYTELQICDPAGTEEWVGASMPVGHDTQYYEDLKGKIEDIPNAPSADGTYTLKVTVSGGVATYSWE